MNFTGERRSSLIKMLLESPSPVGLVQLQRRLGCSRRTVYYLISQLNEEFSDGGLGFIHNKRGEGWYLTEEQKYQILHVLLDGKDDLHLSADDRLCYITCWLQFPADQVNIETIERHLGVSRNTVFNDLKRLRSQIGRYGLSLMYEPRRGYMVVGEELSKRAVLMHCLSRLLQSVPYERLAFLDVGLTLDYLSRLQCIARQTDGRLERQDITAIACLMSVIVRSTGRFDCSFLELSELKKLDEYKLVQQFFPELDEYERIYLSVQLLGSRSGRFAQIEESEDDIRLFELAQKIVNFFECVTRCELDEKSSLVNSLFMHFRLSTYYYRLSIQMANPFVLHIRESYPDLYRLVSEACEEYEDLFPFPLLDDEKAYVAMHFGGHLRLSDTQPVGHARVLVVCPSSIATSKLLSREIENICPNVDIVGVTTVDLIEEYRGRVDFIISTTPLDCDIPWLRVSPLLTERDKARIATIAPLGHRMDGPDEGLLNLISHYVPPERMDDLRRDLNAFFQGEGRSLRVGSGYGLGISDVLGLDDIVISQEALDWKASVLLASNPLLRDGVVTVDYVEAMVGLVEEMGPYVVLRNGVAIAHAAPSKGAFSLGLSLLVSELPIHFGEGRDVHLLFVLASPEPESHLKILHEIMMLSKCSGALPEIVSAETPELVLGLLRRFFQRYQGIDG